MTTASSRRRAPAMDPDSRREMIVRAALPLVIEHGSAVTTRQVARAAGIGEGTIFRVFADKEELLDACVTEALSPANALDELALVPMDQPLADRLAEAASTLQAHLDRVGAVVGALHATGGRGRSGRSGGAAGPPDRAAGSQPVREALAELFEPERESLRLPPERAALIFLGLLFAGADRPPTGGEPTDPAPQWAVRDLVDVFLHGVLSQPVET
ncbi:TetR/AcrR family transcriptional regulator [Streptomyces sp. RKCA744]|uniref:TetR/AcrR family transcriptional regulator n=1 Tax=Streptomyces sp. RKCA744 TaxID=2959340 RepID=UPI00209F2E2C|nr:TetR/AcrR family transcriptional regulator [Streptomyces sp. RKCA744]MCO8304748.1 TetR/AcrR family transcriptional regulator [Streptomyces sp. RKCA744]